MEKEVMKEVKKDEKKKVKEVKEEEVTKEWKWKE